MIQLDLFTVFQAYSARSKCKTLPVTSGFPCCHRFILSLLHLLINELLNISYVTHMFNAVNSADTLTFVQNVTFISPYSLHLKLHNSH